MRPRVPLAYAGLLVIALVAVVGFAAFSPSNEPTSDAVATTVGVADPGATMSARVASAVLALRVSDSGNRTATTQNQTTDDTAAITNDAVSQPDDEPVDAETAEEPASAPTTEAPAPLEAKDTTPPSFSVTSPDDGDTVDSRTVEFSGTVEQGATVQSGPYEATVDDDGTWSILLSVVPGANGASFTATDAAGNTTSKRIVVNYDEPETTTTKPPATKTTSAPATTTTTTTKASATTTTSGSSSSKWSPNWPADSGGQRDVENWRPLVEKYWASDRVDCVLGIIKRESGGDPTAYNSSFGASGLMQHLAKYWPGRAAGAGFKDSNGLVASPYSGEANIAAGAHIAGSGSNWYAPWSRLPDYGNCQGS